MVLRKVTVDPVIRSHFGDSVLADLRASMWAKDCQTCGRPFGRFDTPALAVQSTPLMARAMVHHKRCRPAPWQELSGEIPVHTPHLSWRAGSPLYPESTPIFLANPSLESAVLVRQPDGWRVAELDMWVELGFAVDWTQQFTVLPGLTATITPSAITVAAQTSLPGVGFTWNCALTQPSQVAAQVTEQGWIMVGVTRRLDFDALETSTQLMELLEQGHVALAMAELG
jgi:hypothetical protein